MSQTSKKILAPIVLILVFVGLVLFNYSKAQKALKDTKPSPLSIDLVSFPEKAKAGNHVSFSWHVDTAPDLSTSFTTIYWGYESSPSALTKLDSPDAVRYPNSSRDYSSGRFMLPGDFDININLDKPGKVYFRAYSKVGPNHLWTPEESITVTE